MATTYKCFLSDHRINLFFEQQIRVLSENVLEFASEHLASNHCGKQLPCGLEPGPDATGQIDFKTIAGLLEGQQEQIETVTHHA